MLPDVHDGLQQLDQSFDDELFEEVSVSGFVSADILGDFALSSNDEVLQVASLETIYVWREFIFFMRDSLILVLLLILLCAALSFCFFSNS